jgi:tetratricopeptide (TPR) repeat protein
MTVVPLESRQKKTVIILVLTILVLAVYWQVQSFNFINLDDNIYITQNHQIQSGVTYQSVIYAFKDTHTANWHPLTMLSHALDWQLFGGKAGGHHWSSLIIHIFNTVLLFLLLNQLTGAIWRSAMVAALFAIHPINVESVVWVAERKNVLSTFFWILTMLFYVWYLQKPGWRRYLPVLICFAMGLMSKPMLVTLPFVLLLLDYWPLNRTAIDTQNETDIQLSVKGGKARLSFLIWEKIPLFILTAISVCVTLYTQNNVKAVVNLDSLPILKRINNAIVSYGLYIKKMFWPIDLSVFYPQYNIDIWQLLTGASFLVLLTTIVFKYYRKYPYLLTGWFWYLGTLVPVIGLVQVGAQSMADRYAYVPFIGLFIMIVWYVAYRAGKNTYVKFSIAIASLFLILVLSVISWQRCQLWGDQFALWNDVLKNHKVALAYNLRGLAYADQGQYSLAMTDYNAAIALDKKCSEAFNNRGIIYEIMGKKMNALNDYNQAVNLNPKFADAYYNRGILYLKIDQLDAAISDFTTAINIDPDMADYFNNRGVTFRSKGRYDKSFADFDQAIKINKNFSIAYTNRGSIYNIFKQYELAIHDLTKAIDINPGYQDAYFNRAISLTGMGKFDDAITDYRFILIFNSHHIPALNNLGIIFKNMKRYEESSIQFKKILQIKPNDQEALKNLKEIEELRKKH